MPPSPIPAPLPLWAKAVVQIAPYVTSYLISLIDFGEENHDPLLWSRYQHVFTRSTPTGTSEDVAVVTMDIVNITGGAVDATWTTGDENTVATALTTFWASVMANCHTGLTWKELRRYELTFNDMSNPKPFAPSGPPKRIWTPMTSGTGTGSPLPYQCAATITERTPWPKHWGRMYIPGVVQGKVDANGRWTSATVSSLANAYSTLATSLQSAGFFLIVPVTQVDKVPTRGILNVTSVQVDDIPDVMTSRRARQPAIRTRLP